MKPMYTQVVYDAREPGSVISAEQRLDRAVQIEAADEDGNDGRVTVILSVESALRIAGELLDAALLWLPDCAACGDAASVHVWGNDSPYKGWCGATDEEGWNHCECEGYEAPKKKGKDSK